jgi:hypothetical protein
MKECVAKCAVSNKSCLEKDCRSWIDYKKDFNCSAISIEKHGDLTLAQIAERLKLSIVRIKQIQDKALQKLQKKRHLQHY